MRRFVELSLFYFVRGADGYVLWGEGVVSSQAPQGPSVSSENLGDGLRVLRVANDFLIVAKTLQDDVFTYRQRATTAIHLGLKPRPPVMAVPPWRTLGTTATSVLHQFVRVDKRSALGAHANGSTPPRDELDGVLGRALQVIGLDLRGADASRLGDVVLLEDNVHAPAPVSVTTVRGSGAYPEAVQVNIEPHARSSDLDVNLRVTGSDDAILDDVLVHWKPDLDPSFSLPINQRFGGVELRVWRDGRLIWTADLAFILEVGLNMRLLSGTVVLEDRLTSLLERAIQAGKASASALPPTRTVTQQAMGSQVQVGANLREPWRQAFLAARAAVFELAPPPPPAAEYFPQGGGGRAAATMAFVDLLQGGRSFLVDPFFDAYGAADLLPRIPGNVELTILTSLPDDDQRSCAALVAYLNGARGYLPFGIKIRRVTRPESSEPAFHDRYLIVIGPEAAPRGFLLSNSFSGLARKYPMVVAEMSAGTTGAVLQDIERLLASRNVTALWPPPGPGPFVMDSFGPGWRWYLGCLVARGSKTRTSWLATGRAEQWLSLETDGTPRWSTDRTREVLDRILPGRRPISRLLRRSRKHDQRRRAALGFRVAAIGERVARGLDLQVPDVATRLGIGDVPALAAWLRVSFRSPSPWEPYGHWRTRTAVHQALRDQNPTRERVRFGLMLWSDTHVAMDLTREFGRAFVYRVLLVLRPETAFGLAVELGDPTFIAAAFDWWHLEAWHPAVTRAALRSKSAMIKGLGVQSLAAPAARGRGSPLPDPPSGAAVPQLLQDLETVDPTVVAFACLEWAPRVREKAPRLSLVSAAVNRLPSLAPGNLRDAASVLLGNAELLLTVVESVAAAPAAARSTVLDAVAAALGAALRELKDDYRRGEMAKSADAFAAVLLARHNESYEDTRRGIERLLDLGRARAQVKMLSPFRRHPDWQQATAMLAFAQILLLSVRALSGEDVDVEVGPPWSLVAEASQALHAALLAAVREL